MVGLVDQAHTTGARAAQAPRTRRPRRGRRPVAARLLAVLGMLAGTAAVQTVRATPAAAASSLLTLSVVSARTEPAALGGAGVLKGAAITSYRFLINVDNTGQTTQRTPADGCNPNAAGYGSVPSSCKWTSMYVPSNSPVFAQGTEADLAAGITLPDGRYVISVIADGFKLDGVHVTMPLPTADPVVVELQPTPLPAANIQAAVFEDDSPTNGAPDVPAERGLYGFVASLADTLGQITTDVFGNPLCTQYEPGTTTPIVGTGGTCISRCYDAITDAEVAPDGDGVHCPVGAQGKVKIPNVGTNRYALSVLQPNGQQWIQTTTLEGNHDWDTWVMEGATGLDTEFVQAGEPFPAVIFGYVQPQNSLAGGTTVSGIVDAVKVYYPPKGGLGQQGQIFGGLQGAKLAGPIPNPWLALTDLGAGDTVKWVGQGKADGSFSIPNVPDGNYQLTWWDEDQNYILDWRQVTVTNGQPVDLGTLTLNGWWTDISGTVFNDANRNGIQDQGEAGVPNFLIVIRKRDNSLMDRGGRVISTDANGRYHIPNAYPMTEWFVVEAYNDLFYTTGVTYQADNQPTPTTVTAERDANGKLLSTGVDVGMLPIIGLGGRLDWGVHAYNALASNTSLIDPRNGGIVGTVSYDTTRNELNPQYAAVEDWQPGIANLPVNLYATQPCAGATTCDPTGRYLLASDGSYARGPLLNSTTTEQWAQPTSCVARDVDGNPLVHGTDEQVLPLNADAPCLEGPLSGVQFEHGFSTVDGNYGFTDACYGAGGFDTVIGTCADGSAPSAILGGRDYLVEVVSPTDSFGKDIYKVTREEDVNIGNGDQFVPQVPPPLCAGKLHTVDVAGIGTDGAGATVNQTFADLGGSPYEGQQKPLCDTKLVTLNNGKSVVPTFNFFTDVPLPTRFWGLIVDDLNFSADPKSLLYGEKAGVPFAPVGIYDYSNQLMYTAESDYNGLFDVLMPSTNRINCPTPSGVCANLYRFVGNDPGVPGKLNLNYKPNFRTIAAEFEAIPGVNIIADVAPTQVGVSTQLPGGQISQVACALEASAPQLFAVSDPITASGASFTIDGDGFGATRGTGSVRLDGVALPTSAITSWSNGSIAVTLPPGTAPGGRQLSVAADNGRVTVSGLTLHVIGAGYTPTVLRVGPGRTYQPANSLPAVADHAIQRAIDAAPSDAVVVVYPGLTDPDPRKNPRGAYFENLIVSKPVTIQGVGPGGVRANGTTVRGSIVDGAAYGGDSPLAVDWLTKVAALPRAGDGNVNDGAVVTLFAANANTYATSGVRIDGLDLRGGDQFGFPTNINVIAGAPTGLPAQIVTQGGAVFANASVKNLTLSNNAVQNNGGGYGTIRIGTPNLPAPFTDNDTDNVRIVNNRIFQNGGTNLAGAIGVFAGSNGYDIAGNDICGNFSAEYGGGITAYGLSPNGRIRNNRIYANASYDEGGGVMIAGELPAVPGTLSPGSGPVDITGNLIQANLANDDGGGVRFLQAGNFPMNVVNNIVVNNVSTHEGGGISLNDAPNVRVVNNTIMKNQTTATAVTSNGLPAPAGLSTSLNSAELQATLPVGSPAFSRPVVFNDVFWDNRAGTRAGATVNGLGLNGAAVNNWDLGVADGPGSLAPTNSVLQVTTGTTASPTNTVNVDPAVVSAYDLPVSFVVWRGNPAYVGALMVNVDVPPNLAGDYHLGGVGSPAFNRGAASSGGVNAPNVDIDGQGRPARGGYDAGADEIPAPPGTADLSITKTDGLTATMPGDTVTYTITVRNAGPTGVANASVVDAAGNLTGATWTCAAATGSSCTAASGSGGINSSASLPIDGTVTYTLTGKVAPTTGATTANTATVSAPTGVTDPTAANNTATDTDTVPTLTAPAVLDNFNRANAATLGANWSQPGGLATLRVNGNAAQCALIGSCLLAGWAMWNNAPTGYGARQAAAVTFTGAGNGVALVLKGSGGTAPTPNNQIRVTFNGGIVTVGTTTNALVVTSRGTVAAPFASGDVLTAVAEANGNVLIYRTRGATVTLFGHVQIPTTGAGSFPLATGGGRIGFIVPVGSTVDNFAGGNA